MKVTGKMSANYLPREIANLSPLCGAPLTSFLPLTMRRGVSIDGMRGSLHYLMASFPSTEDNIALDRVD